MSIAVILGTRPEAIKMAPVVRELDRRGIPCTVIATGQHREMLVQTCAQLELTIDRRLDVMRRGQSLADLTGSLVQCLDQVIVDVAPELVLVQGDTTSALIGALSAYYRQVPVGHVEAGLRTDDLYSPFPEEGNRRLIAPLAEYHFAPTQRARAGLLREGVGDGRVHVTGNTVIDSLLWAIERPGAVPPRQRNRRALVTLHRRENHGDVLLGLLAALRTLVATHDLEVLFPVHRNPNVHDVVLRELGDVAGVTLVEPLGYLDLVAALASSDLVLTDSGGLQEEAPALGKPVLVLRDTTERPEAIEAGTAMLIGVQPDRVVATTTMLLEDELLYENMATTANPFGDGRAAERIVGTILGDDVSPFATGSRADLSVVA